MSDGQLLLIAIGAFTLYECMRWVPARAWVFQALGGDAWRGSQPWNLFRTRGGGVVMLLPIPPLEPHVATAAWPCVPHEVGLCVWHEESGVARHVPWDRVKPGTDGARLYITPEHHVLCVNATIAAGWAATVKGWMRQPQEHRRKSFLKHASAMLKEKPLVKSAQALELRTRWLRRIGGWLFFVCFLLLPTTYWRFKDTWPTFTTAGVMLFLMIIQAILLARHIRREPRLRKGAVQHIISAALFPPSSMRVADWICATCSPEAHPLTAFKAWGKQEELEALAGRLWREARWPIGEFPERPWNGPEVEALALYFKQHGLATEALENAPSLPEGCTHWCPRCQMPYQQPATECADCGGMKLLPHSEAARQPA